VVGGATFASGGGGYRYDTFTGTFLHLPGPGLSAESVSDDGQVILGSMTDPETGGYVAALWRASTNAWESLGYLPTATLGCGSLSSGSALSGDGTVAAGGSWVNGCQGRAFRWTQADGMVAMNVVGSGGNSGYCMSASGNLIAGVAQGATGPTPAIWAASGAGQFLSQPIGADIGSVRGMNRQGTILLGVLNQKATRWTGNFSQPVTIGAGSALPGWIGTASGIAGNGTIVGTDALGQARIAWIQPNGNGSLVHLSTYVTSNGGTIPEEYNLDSAAGISDDGTRIIGNGLWTGGWLVTISDLTGCRSDISPAGGDGVVNGADLGALLSAWGQPGAADLNSDGTTNGADLGLMLSAWGACPEATGACCVNGVCSQKTPEECALAGGAFVGNYTYCSPFSCANNDACADAIDITANMSSGVPIHGDNTAATPPQYGIEGHDLPEGSPSCHWLGNPGAAHATVWYRFTAPASGIVRLRTCDSTPYPFIDSAITVYSGTCGSLVEFACDEDGCNGQEPYFSDITVEGMVPGQTYYVVVMNSGDWSGSHPGPFVLTIEEF
ncbi:MAG: hypothetical protein JNK53_03555, partial [Phycisphaerae bacterium]|nr:hypothetical protein [Phycisphaerae bacterium]